MKTTPKYNKDKSRVKNHCITFGSPPHLQVLGAKDFPSLCHAASFDLLPSIASGPTAAPSQMAL